MVPSKEDFEGCQNWVLIALLMVLVWIFWQPEERTLD